MDATQKNPAHPRKPDYATQKPTGAVAIWSVENLNNQVVWKTDRKRRLAPQGSEGPCAKSEWNDEIGPTVRLP
jgi:hypothetical protein